MKRILCTASLLLAAAPLMAADVGVSVSVGQPGFYGTIDISNYPRPQVIYAEPVVVRPVPVGVVYQPLYLHVPPGHAKKWSKHCGAYNACGRPVYFVRDDWYNDTYVPAYHERHAGKGKGKGNGNGNGNKHKGNGKGHD